MATDVIGRTPNFGRAQSPNDREGAAERRLEAARNDDRRQHHNPLVIRQYAHAYPHKIERLTEHSRADSALV
jgi:hypothetical protein